MAYEDFANLARQQSNQSIGYGQQAAEYADPFRAQRGQYQNQLSALMKNPGEFSSSPVYKFAYDQGLDAINRRAAAQGRLKSGNYLSELMDYGKKSVSQLYFPQANLLSNLSGATTGSPAAAGLSYARGAERSQDYSQMGAAAGAYGRSGGAGGQQPWWMAPQQMPTTGSQSAGWTNTSGTGLPSGGYGPVNNLSSGTYFPTTGAGTGSMWSDSGQTDFGGGLPSGYGDYSQEYSDPFSGYDSSYETDYLPYEYSDSGDYGGYDYGGYDDYYGEEY